MGTNRRRAEHVSRGRHQAPQQLPVAVYRFYDQHGAILYVGVTAHLTSRFRSHSKTKAWWIDVDPDRTVIEWHDSAAQASWRERTLIAELQPPMNSAGVTTPYVPYNPNRAATSITDDAILMKIRSEALKLARIDARLAALRRERDNLMRLAKEQGATWAELEDASGMHSPTAVARALKRGI